jgi:hypothetical protein
MSITRLQLQRRDRARRKAKKRDRMKGVFANARRVSMPASRRR